LIAERAARVNYLSRADLLVRHTPAHGRHGIAWLPQAFAQMMRARPGI